MTRLTYLLVAGASPLSRHTMPLHGQVILAVEQGLWGSLLTQSVGVTWETAP